MKPIYKRNHENSIHEDMTLYKEYLKSFKRKDSLFSYITNIHLILTSEKYEKTNYKTIKNGLNIIKNIPCNENGDIEEEVNMIVEWIYKRMYIENIKEVDFIQMKRKYEEERKKEYNKIRKRVSRGLFKNY